MIESNEYRKVINSFLTSIVGESIERIFFCMTSGINADISAYEKGQLMSSDHGYDIVFNSGRRIHIQCIQKGWTFGLELGEETILSKLNNGQSSLLIDKSKNQFIDKIVHKVIRSIDYKLDIDHDVVFIESISIKFDDYQFSILAGEYDKQKSKIIKGADEAMLILGSDAAGKYID